MNLFCLGGGQVTAISGYLGLLFSCPSSLNFLFLSGAHCGNSTGQSLSVFSLLPHMADKLSSPSTHDLDSLISLLDKFGVLNCLTNLRICNKFILLNT